MSAFTPDRLKQAMVDAGLEIYRANGTEIRVAERVRVHLMDSGVAISLQDGARVHLTIRGQRSDFPGASADDLFAKVRNAVRSVVEAQGFREVNAATREITDPVDANHVLDVWHELTFAKDIDALETMVDDVRWALRVPKCVDP